MLADGCQLHNGRLVMAQVKLIIGSRATGKTVETAKEIWSSNAKELVLSMYSEPIYVLNNIHHSKVKDFCLAVPAPVVPKMSACCHIAWSRTNRDGKIVGDKAVCNLYGLDMATQMDVIETALNHMNFGCVTVDDASLFMRPSTIASPLIEWLDKRKRQENAAVGIRLVYHDFNSVSRGVLDDFWTHIRLHRTLSPIRHAYISSDMRDFLEACQKQVNLLDSSYGQYVFGNISRADIGNKQNVEPSIPESIANQMQSLPQMPFQLNPHE